MGSTSTKCCWLLTVVLLVLGVAGCSKPVKPEEIPGRYELKYRFGTDVLILWPDGVYQRTLQYDDGKVFRGGGKWSLVGPPKLALVLDNFDELSDLLGYPATRPAVVTRCFSPLRWGGRIELPLAEEVGSFVKVGPASTQPATQPSRSGT